MTTLRAVSDRWANEAPGFDRQTADFVYAEICKRDPDEAAVWSRLVLNDVLVYELLEHRDEIAKAFRAEVHERFEEIRDELMTEAISKRNDPEAQDRPLRMLYRLSKAFELTTEQHEDASQRAKKQARSLTSGEFVQEHVRIDAGQSPSKMQVRAGMRRPEDWGDLSGHQQAAYQNAYHQIAQLIAPYQNLPGTGYLHVIHASDRPGVEHITKIPGRTKLLGGDVIDPSRGEVVSAKVSVIPGLDAPGAYFDAASAVLGPRAGATVSGATRGGALDAKRLGSFEQHWNQSDINDQYTSQQGFRRLQAGSSLISDTLGPGAPPQARLALAVAQHVGGLGPVAQRIVGPTADRLAYRYRGTERKPDPRLVNAVQDSGRLATRVSVTSADAARADREADELLHARLGASTLSGQREDIARSWDKTEQAYKAGKIDRKQRKVLARQHQEALDRLGTRSKEMERRARTEHKESKSQAKTLAGRGVAEQSMTARSIATRGYTDRDAHWHPGPVLSYVNTLVPTQDLNALHLAAGTVPPSEGFVLDAKGNVATQAIGYGDDHYLPFNLKGLAKLRGGEYVRTRSWGGPTTEDLFTGLTSGAKGFTVVSNSGVFTVEFDPTFHGGRRFNDKAARIVGRYGHLLDAVKEGRVTTGVIAPEKDAELKAKARGMYPDVSSEGYAREISRLRGEERSNPTLSQAQRDQTAVEWLRDQANGQQTRTGTPPTADQYVDSMVTSRARAAYAGYLRSVPEAGENALPESFFVTKERELLTGDNAEATARKIALQTGGERALDQKLEGAQRQYASSLRELSLNGPGYDAALKALKEQFPYYIRSVNYRPASEFGNDTGYVKPKFNRPSAALAGYFDASIGGDTGSGTGKATADSIRNQNRSVMQGRLVPVSPSGRPGRPAPAGAATAESGTPAAGMNDTDRRDLQMRADRAMLTALRGQTSFGPGATLNGEPNAKLAAANPAVEVKGAEFPPELAPIYSVPLETLLAQQERDPAAMRATLDLAHAWAKDHHAFSSIPEPIVSNFEARGQAPTVRKPGGAATMLAHPNDSYDFGGQSGLGASATSEEAALGYFGDERVRTLVKQGLLPQYLDAEDFGDRSSAALAALTEQDDALAEWKRNGRVGLMPTPEGQHEQMVEGLVRANQYARRHAAAIAREQRAATAAAAAQEAAAPKVLYQNIGVPAQGDSEADSEYRARLAALNGSAEDAAATWVNTQRR